MFERSLLSWGMTEDTTVYHSALKCKERSLVYVCMISERSSHPGTSYTTKSVRRGSNKYNHAARAVCHNKEGVKRYPTTIKLFVTLSLDTHYASDASPTIRMPPAAARPGFFAWSTSYNPCTYSFDAYFSPLMTSKKK